MILVTGATGLIGQELIRLWIEKEYKIHYLTTRKNHKHPHPNVTPFYWNPESEAIDLNCFEWENRTEMSYHCVVDVMKNFVSNSNLTRNWFLHFGKILCGLGCYCC